MQTVARSITAMIRRLCAFWNSSIGKKILVACSGIFLVLFLTGHLAGNLVVFAGPAAFNDYAEFLHHMLHGTGIWLFRALMVVAVVTHVTATLSLARRNREAHQPYQYPATIQASRSSLIMIWSGLTILCFLTYHLLHFTACVANSYDVANRYFELVRRDGVPVMRHNAWQMVIDGFSWWPASLFYVIALSMLCSHLSHGISSVFQTLGVRSRKTSDLIHKFSLAYSGLLWAGFVSIPIAIFLFGFGR